ncbi:hypothetical protein CRE_30874 [Caenorhabditis remanei]|uniref:Uncharacterized protein n=1 Tax=Caenorhabditis remanei TaxID=31234 RepID=E3LUR2_CAERE|nr:hypothetical protein CRE_30874 [Caenorhabditis remanei]
MLYVFLFFATYSHAEFIISYNNTTSASSSAISAQKLLSLNTNATPPSSQFTVKNESRFEEMHQDDEGLIDRKSIDRMVDELLAIHDKIEKAISEMRRNDYKCFDSVKYVDQEFYRSL